MPLGPETSSEWAMHLERHEPNPAKRGNGGFSKGQK